LPYKYTKSLIALMKKRGKRAVVGGGVFFGEIHAASVVRQVYGFVHRERRHVYVPGLDGKQHLLRPHDGRKVSNANAPHLLAKAAAESEHHEVIDYRAIMTNAMKQASSQFRLQHPLTSS
jgi:hypothetical protein